MYYEYWDFELNCFHSHSDPTVNLLSVTDILTAYTGHGLSCMLMNRGVAPYILEHMEAEVTSIRHINSLGNWLP